MSEIEPSLHFQRLFDHIPGVHFFAKDRAGFLMFASRGLLDRYKMSDDSEFVGLTDYDINPRVMAEGYVQDDQLVLSGRKKLVERIELWWDPQGMPDWYLVTKLPLSDKAGRISGVMGILRRPDDRERQLPVFQTVAKAVEIIRRDFSQPLRVEDVAASCGQSLRQLQRRFQSAFGISPQEFLIKTRILTAMRLLEETAQNSSEIAALCGFVDVSSFTQHFRKRTGFTPSAYRRSKRRP
jgi:AraC-like DNA-binding protein